MLLKSLSIGVLVLLLSFDLANADRRKYAWTYPFATIEPEATELEFYQTTKLNNTNKWEVNPIYEFFWAPGEPIHEPGLDIGVSYELTYRFSFGFESVSRWKYQNGSDDKQISYAGPTFSLASGSVFYTVGYLAGLTDDSDDARVRLLMGVKL